MEKIGPNAYMPLSKKSCPVSVSKLCESAREKHQGVRDWSAQFPVNLRGDRPYNVPLQAKNRDRVANGMTEPVRRRRPLPLTKYD